MKLMLRSSRIFSTLAAGLAALAIACGNDAIKDLLTVGVDVDIDPQTVPGLLPISSCDLEDLGALLPGLFAPITLTLEDEDELQGFGPIDDFASVKLEKIDLDIINVPAGDSDDWDFVDAVRLFADDPTDAEPPVLVAELDPVPSNVTALDIPGTGVELAGIASSDDFVVSGSVTGRLPCDQVQFAGEADFEVELFD